MRAATGLTSAGRWLLPGGGVRHGEHPADTVVREVEEETGLRVAIRGIRHVLTDVNHLSDISTLRHQDRLIYDVRAVGGDLRPEPDGSSDRAAWVSPEQLERLPLMPYVARLLGAAAPEDLTVWSAAVPAPPAPVRTAAGGLRHQRFASYGLVTDPSGRVLLTRIAAGYPGAGHWHLPGGGTDFGEDAVEGLLRELAEETDQRGHVEGLITVSHRHHRAAVGPEGLPIDWHGVRVVFRVRVDEPTVPRVIETRGSTVAARWLPPGEALSLPLTEVARDALGTHLDG